MKKRLVSALLALSMLCSALPAPAFAQGADSAGLEQEQCSCSIRCTADGMNPDCPVCAADAAACGAGLDPATVETADPEPTPEPTVTPEPTEVPEATVTPEPTEAPATTQEPAEQNLAVPSLLAAAAFAAADNGKSIQLADSETAANIGGGQADNIYFGNYFQSSSTTKEPVKWRVLSNSDGKLFLLSDQNLDVKPYNSSSTGITWEKSTIRSWLNGYAASENNSGTDYSSNNFIDAAFSSDEQVAIADTYVYNKNDPSYSTSGGEDTTDQIFLLSIEEANNSSYFPNGSNSRKSTNTAYVASYSGMLGAGKADYWWLRSPGGDDDYAAFVDDGGVVFNNGYIVGNRNTAVRPAFNLNLNSVLFTSAAAGGKSASGMDSGLTAVGGYDGNEWKLTLLDSSRNFSVTEETASGKPGDTITLNYTGASTGDNENISVILADDSGAQYYGRIAKPTTADGQVKITIPASLADGTYTLNVFSEQYNGGENDDTKLTDYASAFEAVTLTVDTTAPTLSNGSATRDSETTATVKFTSDEAGEYYYTVVESGATEPTDIVSGDSANMASGENTITLTNLTAGTKDIYIVAKDAMGNVSQTLQIVIPEFIPTYTISASPAALNFSNKTVGYTEAPDGQTVTITNTGNQTVTVTLPTSTNYTITAETGFVDGTATLAPNGTATFAVQPKTGLAVGSYSETLTISSNHNTSAEVSLAFTVDPKSLDGAQVQVSGSYIYDGNAKEPSGENVTVTLDGEPLTENTDYTLSYEDNTDAGEATVKVSGKGNYSGIVTGTFQIAKAKPTVTDVAVSSPETIYDTTDISSITLSHARTDTPGTVALDAGQTLTVGTRDYTWTFTPDDANNYTTATGSIALTVVEDTVKSIAVTTPPTKTTYTYGDSFDKAGMEVTATCESGKTKDVTDRVTVSPETLTTSVTVLTISYGELTTTQFITVNPKEVSNPSIELSGTSFEFTGEAITPTVVSVKDGETVIPETEYTVSYSNNVNVGTNATVTITDKEGGNYTVSGSTTFQITKVVATVTQVPTANTLTYTGQPQTLVMAGTATGGTMQYSTEENGPYDTAIPTGTNAGEYTVWYKVAGDANHSDTQPMEVKVTISQASIAEAEVTLSPESFTYNGQSQTPTVTVKLNGNALTEGDYTVTYSGDSIDAGTYTVTVTGKGNYAGTADNKPTYTINPAALTISDATLAAKTYDGTTDATVTDVTFTEVQGSDALTLGNDYTATAKFDTADAGTGKTATVTVTLKNGNYKLASDTYQLTGQTIAKANATVTAAPTAVAELTYNGQAQTLVTAGTAAGGTMVYSLEENGKYTEGIPTGTNAGSYTVYYYVKGDANHNDTTPVSMTVSIAQKAATIAVRLTPANRIYVGDGLPAVGLAYTGLVEGESIAPDSITVDGMPADSNTAKEYALTVSKTTREEILALEAAENYTITFTDVTLTILEKEVVVLPTEDENRYRLEQSELTEVPAELKEKYSEVDDIQNAMFLVAVEKLPGITAENTELHDVTLLFSEDGGQTWIKADKNNFPANGITVTLPYPDGTNAADYDFVVTHMVTVAKNDLNVGDVETPAVTKTADGLRFTVKSLSPVAVSWKLAPKTESSTGSGESTSPAATPAPTATPAPAGTVYYTCPKCGYHDWTATDTGYRCDTCGYVESLKQLAGYGNVKGVYEPKTGSNTAGGHAVTVPQTGDTSNPALWLGLLLLSGLALGGITLYRRKKTQ